MQLRRYRPRDPRNACGPGGAADEHLEPASDGGWQSRRFPAGSHRAREYADHADFPSTVRLIERDA